MIMHNSSNVWMLHYIRSTSDKAFPYLKGCSVEQFSQFLDYISDQSSIIHPNDFFNFILDRNTKLPKNAQLLTFDDGLQDHYRWVFPELKKRGLSALFFVSTGSLGRKKLLSIHKIHALYGAKGYPWLMKQFLQHYRQPGNEIANITFLDPRAIKAYPYDDEVTAGFKYAINYLIDSGHVNAILDQILVNTFDEKKLCEKLYMSAAEIQEMNDAGMVFGFHGHTHRPFSQLTPDELSSEMDNAISIFSELLPSIPKCVSYPYGDKFSVTEENISILKSKGLHLGFMAEKMDNTNRSNENFYISRIDIVEWQKTIAYA